MALDLAHFRKNALDLRELKSEGVRQSFQEHEVNELRIENERLTQMLQIQRILPTAMGRTVTARVIGRSPSAWNRVLLIDKGAQDGILINQPVLSDKSLVGKIIEVGSSASKALLMTDPNSRIGVLIQRTRQQGVLYGMMDGECRIKYLSVDSEVKEGDVVESAGFGGFFPKGLLVGEVTRAWKEPGQIYQVAEVRPSTDLSRVEEVACLV